MLRGGVKKPPSGWWDPARPPGRRSVIGGGRVAREAERRIGVALRREVRAGQGGE